MGRTVALVARFVGRVRDRVVPRLKQRVVSLSRRLANAPGDRRCDTEQQREQRHLYGEHGRKRAQAEEPRVEELAHRAVRAEGEAEQRGCEVQHRQDRKSVV